MSRPAEPHLTLRLRQARRRLFLQALLHRLTLCWVGALALSLAWFLLAPLAWPGAPGWLRWAVLGGTGLIGTAAGVIWAVRSAPSRLDAALQLDRRFGLCERVTTALSLTPAERASPAGLALLADVDRKLASVQVGSRFPVRLRWPLALVPAQALALVLVALFYEPVLPTAQAGTGGEKRPGAAGTIARKPDPIDVRPFVPPPSDRPGKSEKLKQLERDLEKLLGQVQKPDPTPEQAREQVRETARLEERMEEFARQQAEKFQALQEQMDRLGRLDKEQPFEKGPAKDAHDALAKGDIEKAREQVDRLMKKVRKKELSREESEQLQQQLKDLQKRLEQLAQQEERKKELEEMIRQAKAEGRDAESLERELQRLEGEIEQAKDLQEMARKMSAVRKALEAGDMEKAAEELEQLAGELQDLGEELKDLEAAEEHLQRLKELRKQLCSRCQGEGEGGDRPGNGLGKGRGEGERPDNPNAQTSGEDQRVRARFNPLGRKFYGGPTTGPAFTKRSTVEMEGEIKQAAQEAPEAIEVQRLPRDAREMVREYFERLGGQGK